MNYTGIAGVIRRGFEVIENEQDEHGGFSTQSGFQSDFSESFSYLTTFAAANILNCLNGVHQSLPELTREIPDFEKLRRRTAEFLLSERSAQWSWNYWSHAEPERERMPYPDDLDDTFAVLSALHGYDAKLVDGTVLADVVKLLTAAEIEPGGPYRTWLVPRISRNIIADAVGLRDGQDVDLVVNSTIGYFLSRFEVVLPKLDAFIEDKIKNGSLASPYYPGLCHAAYFASRYYRGPTTMKIIEYIFDKRGEDGLWDNPLESAMAFSALSHYGFGESIPDADIDLLMEKIEEEGWRPHPFCMDPSRGGKPYYAGSRALTAAFVMEVLAKLSADSNERRQAGKIERHEPAHGLDGGHALGKAKNFAEEAVRGLPRPLRTAASDYIKGMKDAEIALVPYRMCRALGEVGREVPVMFLSDLALGNLYGWMAYGIYDGFMDGEGEARLLPAANFFLREVVMLYREIGFAIPSFDKECDELMKMVDDANFWEISNCRMAVHAGILELPGKFPEGMVRRFAERSMAHALPAIGVSLLVDDEDIRTVQAIKSFFGHYLSARQLHDDAHDWADDLAHGRLSPVNARLLEEWQFENSANMLDLEKELPGLRRKFWESHVDHIVRDIKRQTEKARHALDRSLNIANPKPLVSLLEKLESAADHTLAEREEMLKFLDAYSSRSAMPNPKENSDDGDSK